MKGPKGMARGLLEFGEVYWYVALIVILFLLVGVSFLSNAYEFIGLHYRKARAKSQIRRFDEMMSRIDRGTFTGTPLSTNEQVLRAVCKCNIERNVYRDLYRVDPLSPIAFECDATTGTENRLPPTPIVWRTLSSCNSKSFV
ncbi:unnamed protein product [Nippostrongylus brasiliensis]|uniref:Uncharacterized protein n=1 Tax=Nippostrongylus brasiliensis TaxID=27835 RepID=A0A0N4YTQ9_NIPBR|nr:unnamed protein product [Nippostrongylus brasiliensis]